MKISLNNQDIRRGESLLLRAVTFSFDQPQLIGIIGKNGSGKSSLLKTILETISIKERGRKISWLPQIVEIPSEYTVKEFLRLSRYPYRGEALSEEQRAIESALSSVAMNDYTNREFGSLSGGERQRILVASLLAQETEILLADEPTTFLDPYGRRDLFKLFSEIVKKQKKLVIIVTHDIEEFSQFADQILALKQQSAEFISIDQLKDNLQEIYA